MSASEKPAKRITRGPRRLEYLPAFAKSIRGIAHVTTVSQLMRLKEFMSIDPEKREPFIRLGCSVSHDRTKPRDVAQHSTWAVSCDGEVEVIRKDGDPRSAHKWFSNPGRSWNVFHQFRPDPDLLQRNRERRGVDPAYYVAMLAVTGEDDDSTNSAFQPDGDNVLSVRYRKVRTHDGIVEALVLGRPGWYEAPRFRNLLFSLREAVGEFFANEDGAVWVAAEKCVEFPALSFADMEAMAHNRREVADLKTFLKDQARLYIRSKLQPFGAGKALEPSLETAIAEVLSEQNLQEISLPELDALVPSVQQRAVEKAA